MMSARTKRTVIVMVMTLLLFGRVLAWAIPYLRIR
jgi:hypothetical protein